MPDGDYPQEIGESSLLAAFSSGHIAEMSPGGQPL